MRKEKRANGPHTSHRIRAGLLAVCLTLGAAIPGGAWAAEKDPRQAVSGDEATLTMGKILTANHAGKFPSTLRDVKYKLTAVRGFDNATKAPAPAESSLRRRTCLCRKRLQQSTIR